MSNRRRNGSVGLVVVLSLLFVHLSDASTAHATTGTLVITPDTVLTEDHVGNIMIGADGVTLDCQDHEVAGSGDGIGILLSGRTAVTIQSCAVTNFGIGVLLDSSSGNTLHKNTVTDNARFGFRLFRSDDNVLKSNVAADNGRTGFFLTASSRNILKKNDANGHGSHGFRVSVSSNDNDLRRNTATSNGIGFGLIFTSGNTLKMNTGCGNTSFDLRRRSSMETTFFNNNFCLAFGMP